MSAEDVREAVAAYIKTSGIDFLKYASSAHAHGRFLAFSDEAQRAIVEEAHAAGLTAQACAQAPGPLKTSIEAGVDLLQHGDVTGTRPMPDDIYRHIVEQQLPCVAQVLTERHIEFFDGVALHAGVWGDILKAKDANDRRLIAGGAKLMLSTDGGLFGPTASSNPLLSGFLAAPDLLWHLGSSHMLWLQAAVDRGMSTMDALLSVTRNIAEGYQMQDELGTVEPGRRADLVVLDGNPLEDIANYGRIAHVVKDGDIVDRDLLPDHPILTADWDHPALQPPV
jgi:imidazolonepropionase-like amidohydrolase